MDLSRIIKLIALNLIIAVIYFLFGAAGLQLGVFSGYATAIFPAAGIAFVAIFSVGSRLLPAVWLGSTSINLWMSSKFGGIDIQDIVVAASIGTASCLQAWVAVVLVKHFCKPSPEKLLNTRDSLCLLFLAGPIACLTAASWAGVTLLTANIISSTEFASHWLHWWLGDTLGVILFTPLLLMTLNYRKPWWSQRIKNIVPPILTTLIITLLIFFYVADNEKKHITNQLKETASPIAESIKSKLSAYQELVASIGNLIKVNPSLEYSLFDHFTESILANHPELSALSWNPRISSSDKPQFEAYISQQMGMPNMRITQRDELNQLVPAKERNSYVPVAYISPLSSNRKAIGYDISSNPMRSKALNLANTTGKMAITAPIQLIQDTDMRMGLLLVTPVMPDSPSDSPDGYAVGVFHLDTIWQQVFSTQLPEGLSLVLEDIDSSSKNTTLFHSEETTTFQDFEYSWVDDIYFGGRNWRLSIYASPNYLASQQSLLAWQVLLAGLIFTCLLQLLLLTITGHHYTILQKAEQLFADQTTILNNKLVAMVTVHDRHIVWANSAMELILGYDKNELNGSPTRQCYANGEDYQSIGEAYANIRNEGVIRNEFEFVRKDGQHIWVDMSGTILHKKTNESLWIFVNVTERKQAEQEIEDLAYYDPLTNLPNRRLMLDRIWHAMAASARSGNEGALLFLDIDHFKTLNDTLGHDMGDIFLQQVAERLTTCVREGDTVSRFGGDEFVVLLEGLSTQAAEAAAQAEDIANKILSSINQPYQLASHHYTSSTSVGITLFNNHQTEVEELLKQADIAMYQAKDDGRNALRFFDPQMQASITARAELENELNQAIEQQQFQLYYQIQMDSSLCPLGAEALIRWIHPERGLISPLDFIPVAEQNGTILSIGQWVLNTACAQLELWQQDALTRELTLSVNVSAKQFHQADFISQVTMTIQQHNIKPARLKLELTESLLLNDIEDTIAKMKALAGIGIQFSLDDFGTGYSSLQYLKQLPLHQLKIDKSFVDDLVSDSNDQVIVRTIIAMAHSLGLSVIAEGVETKEQQQRLLTEGCTHYQGYLFSKPLPIAEFNKLLKEQGVS